MEYNILFDLDLVWQMQLMIIKGKNFRIYFCIPEIFKMNM